MFVLFLNQLGTYITAYISYLVQVVPSGPFVLKYIPAAAARAWNSLPTRVRNAPTLVAFRQELKTVLFRDCFPVD